MAINLQIYSNATNKTKAVSFDFQSDIIAINDDPTSVETIRHYFKFTTGAKDTSGVGYSPRIVEDLSDLALNDAVQSASNNSSAYSNVDAMVTDYVYDYIYGHTANQYSSGVDAKDPMDFS